MIARRLGLAAVLLVSLGLSLLWLVRVPFFESPDENAHAPDEHIALENYFGGIKSVALFYEQLAG